MGVKTRVVVTQYESPVDPVVLNQTDAANSRYGEMMPEHARRERRHQRSLWRDGPARTVSDRFW